MLVRRTSAPIVLCHNLYVQLFDHLQRSSYPPVGCISVSKSCIVCLVQPFGKAMMEGGGKNRERGKEGRGEGEGKGEKW